MFQPGEDAYTALHRMRREAEADCHLLSWLRAAWRLARGKR